MTEEEKIIEIGARGAYDRSSPWLERQWDEALEGSKRSYIEDFTASLSAIRSAGYEIVPREPTDDMCRAMAQTDFAHFDQQMGRNHYRALCISAIAASPLAKKEP